MEVSFDPYNRTVWWLAGENETATADVDTAATVTRVLETFL